MPALSISMYYVYIQSISIDFQCIIKANTGSFLYVSSRIAAYYSKYSNSLPQKKLVNNIQIR